MTDLATKIREMREREAELRAEVERLKASMIGHFQREHLEGDGPEIDRWRLRGKDAEAAADRLLKQLDVYIAAHGEEATARQKAEAALAEARTEVEGLRILNAEYARDYTTLRDAVRDDTEAQVEGLTAERDHYRIALAVQQRITALATENREVK